MLGHGTHLLPWLTLVFVCFSRSAGSLYTGAIKSGDCVDKVHLERASKEGSTDGCWQLLLQGHWDSNGLSRCRGSNGLDTANRLSGCGGEHGPQHH